MRATEHAKGPDNHSEAIYMTVKDSNGTELKDGDNVTLIKDLKVKGANTTLKRGTLIKGIRLTGDEDEIDCRHEKIKGLVLRTEFVKKA
jgi:protein PhnA